MVEPRIATPRKILLATDLTCRCDRALDRSVQVAQELGAELLAAYVSPPHTPEFDLDRTRRWRNPHDPTERMRWRLRRDLASATDNVRAIVEEGDPAEKLIEIALREDCDLIVAGTARADSFRRMIFGSTVNRVLRGVNVPILVVHDRPAGRYRNIVIASDFSDASIRALQTTSTLFPDAELTLFHAYDIPYAGFIIDQDLKRDLRSIERQITSQFLGDPRIAHEIRDKLTVVIEHGMPAAALGAFVDDQHVDLTVIGSHGRSAFFDAIIGSTAKQLVETLEGDLLIVRWCEAEK